ncbi:MAG TPA: glycosyltransferase [Patescibacteria group bacterium]
MPRFSVLIPVIKEKFLTDAVGSVLKQSFEDWELILYNDCSRDDIDGIVGKYGDERIRYYKGEKNLGAEDPSITWNRMLEFANGEYICLLGDDDCVSDNYLSEMNKLIIKYPHVDLFRAKLKRINESGKEIFNGDTLPEFETWDQTMFQRMVKKRAQSTCEFVLKREKLLKIGGYVNFPRACGSDDATYLLMAEENGIMSTNNASGYWRSSSLNISDNDSREMNEYKSKFYLKWEREFLDRKFHLNVPLYELYGSIERGLSEFELENVKNSLSASNAELTLKLQEFNALKNELLGVYSSREWKAVLILRKMVKMTIPKGSFRRKMLVGCWKAIRLVFKLAKKIKPKKRRRINFKSKKIALIGHSYHKKTKSSEFLMEYLKEFFNIEVIFDDSWQEKPFVDLSFVDDSYLAVIFWQSIPSPEMLKSIKNENILFFPMYDQSGRLDLDYWEGYRRLKFVNFSNALHRKLSKWGFDSLHVKYFPKPQEFIPGKKKEAFFWQRLTEININTVSKIFNNKEVKIHIHRAIDPYQEFVQPSEKDEKKFQITYSDWFETREEMWDVIKQKGIYIAPREFEGIGMSFLEAMAMGKAVIAVNNPTMNEYIVHGKTGFLYDLSNPQEIDLSDIENIQKNTHEFMWNGFKKWENEKHKIIDFILKKH